MLKRAFLFLSVLFIFPIFSSAQNSISLKPNSMVLTATPWQLTADGHWRSLAQIQFTDSSGLIKPWVWTKSGLTISAGKMVGLASWVDDDLSSHIILQQSQPVTVTAWSLHPYYPSASLQMPAPPADLQHFQVIASQVGPYANAIGWTPLDSNLSVQKYRIWRIHAGESKLLATLPANQSSYFDSKNIQAGEQYRYQIDVSTQNQGKIYSYHSNAITSAQSLPKVSLNNFHGKGMLIFFNPMPNGGNSYTSYPVSEVVAKAQTAKLNFILLQLQYGEYSRLTNPGVTAWFNELLTALHRHHIKLIAWVVPRNPSIETEKNLIQLLNYHTASGDHLDGVALDIEEGGAYMGSGPDLMPKINKLLSELRAAVGADYPLAAIVPMPEAQVGYPYSILAQYINLAAPMIFWHNRYLSEKFLYTQPYVNEHVQASLNVINDLFQKKLPLVMIGQSADLGQTGAPSANEISWALDAARQWGVKGTAFFDWGGIQDYKIWDVLRAYSH